ncbi:MAG: helix-turn-helix domain-containing protein [Armatimonadetes bacterium]|nr:helix-turn-helix domain-containing protein [Armatimonadota bacterium]
MAQVQKDFYNINSLAEAFGVTPDAIRELADAGEIPARKVGDEYIFSSLAVHAWLTDGVLRAKVPHGEPTAAFRERVRERIERYRPLMERLANE